ncbi:glycosyltransferase family A protein [Limosilactobacillus reuteri]|uniref:glycosyltransferase family A protein n=1 Tax=Limosilactobacillus reuteri TaxID=1598 RepID=UPI00080C869B|nr:glycosyltransferase family A protein [Limosilactobacillus reuteri]ANU51434.1 hypothetical protein A4V07_03795 [Limosilactobacillus reuteri]OXE59088.1 hypothetical protein ADH69_00110 [Limosilactobacillus reuteri]QQR14624.1 glycosyltransferase family 2 protein [Limosilactobacillus reuteri]
MRTKPVLTVVVPVYNSEKYLDRCFRNLNKMIGDNLENVEVLFINDGSTDATFDRLKYKTKNKPQYQVINKAHTGVSDTRNYGINLAKGQYITFLDSDDDYCKNFISTFLVQIENKPDIVWNDVINLTKDRFQNIDSDESQLTLMKMVLGISEEKIQEGIASKFYKTSFLKEKNLFFNSKVVIAEDTLFILQALSEADSIYLSNKRFYYVLEEHSLNKFNPLTLEGELEFQKQIRILLEKYNDSSEKKLVEARTKINGFIILIYRYFGPLVEKKRISINRCVRTLEHIDEEYQYCTAFSTKINYTKSVRYKLLIILLKKRKYKLAIKLDILLDKLKQIEW